MFRNGKILKIMICKSVLVADYITDYQQHNTFNK